MGQWAGRHESGVWEFGAWEFGAWEFGVWELGSWEFGSWESRDWVVIFSNGGALINTSLYDGQSVEWAKGESSCPSASLDLGG
jgi:hypothetical protein